MSDERIQRGLEALFDEHRVVFWYDDRKELRDAFEEVALDGVTKVEIANNEFGLKVRMLRREPKQKFLVYKHGPAPEPLDNWLCDVQLANAVFHADQISMWLNAMGLGPEFRELVGDHAEFFKAKKRFADLKLVLAKDDTGSIIRHKMLCVCVGSEPAFGAMLEALLEDHANGKDDRLKLIERVGLAGFFWEQIGKRFGYKTDEPTLEDFALALFKNMLSLATGGSPELRAEARIFHGRWKTNKRGAVAFEKLSHRYADVLGVQGMLEGQDWRAFQEFDGFEAIERAVIRGLMDALTNKTLARWDVEDVVASRRNSHWYGEFKSIYDAISEAARFFYLLSNVDLRIESFADGVKKYASTWFEIDQAYRRYVTAARTAGQPSLTEALTEEVENLYVNRFVLLLGNAWQAQVDALTAWSSDDVLMQRDFWRKSVGAYRKRDQKVCVIISDAMRYEIGEELCRRIRSLDRYDARCEPMLSALPTYTQLGMAALLPHTTLSLAGDGEAALVLADGQSTQGLAAREKILRAAVGEPGAIALRADDFLKMNKDDARAVTRDHAVIYIYHNQIDAVGDKRDTEERTFDAVEDALSDIDALVRKLTGANASHILITSDHGFLFQQRSLEDSDFLAGGYDDKAATFINRRFVIGKGFKDTKGFRRFSSEALGLDAGFDVLSPKSINRLRRQGSGSRFVHGGATLQEAVIPLIAVSKTRQSDVTQVDIEALATGPKVITTNQFSVKFYQSAPVSEKVAPRTLSIGLYASDGELISDQHEVVFDAASNDVRDREKTLRLLLASNAGGHNEQDVQLRLREKHAGTSHFKDYKSVTYRLRNRISGDFDF